MTLQKEKLTTDLSYVTDQRDKAVSDKEELDRILRSRSDSLSQSIFELRRKVADLDAENAKLKAENASLVKAREEQVQKVSSTYESLLEKMKSEISKGQITISELKGKLTVNMVDSILFDSGKAEVKKGGLEILGKVVSILKDVKRQVDPDRRAHGRRADQPRPRPAVSDELGALRGAGDQRHAVPAGPGDRSRQSLGRRLRGVEAGRHQRHGGGEGEEPEDRDHPCAEGVGRRIAGRPRG